MAIGAIVLFQWAYSSGIAAGIVPSLALAKAQTMAVTTVILMQVFYLLNCRSLTDSIFTIGVFSNPIIFYGIGGILVLQAAYMYIPALAMLFGAAPLSAAQWGWSALVAASVLPVMALDKFLSRRSESRSSSKHHA